MDTLTQNQIALTGVAIVGGIISTFLIIGLLFYVLLVIAMWKIFTKAGEAGWKSLIPIYNVYILYKICGMKNWFWISLIVGVVVGVIKGFIGENTSTANVFSIILGIFNLVIGVMLCSKMAKAFGKGLGYTLGLIFLPNIFTLILGFGSAEYIGTENN